MTISGLPYECEAIRIYGEMFNVMSTRYSLVDEQLSENDPWRCGYDSAQKRMGLSTDCAYMFDCFIIDDTLSQLSRSQEERDVAYVHEEPKNHSFCLNEEKSLWRHCVATPRKIVTCDLMRHRGHARVRPFIALQARPHPQDSSARYNSSWYRHLSIS